MNTKTATCLLGILAMASLAGCAKEELSSDTIKTAGISATISVTAGSDSSSRVHVTLQAGGNESNTYIRLDSGDKLIASAGTDNRDMSEVDTGEYEAEFGVGDGGTEFKVDFQRPNDTSAPDSRGTLPAPFSIGAITEDLSRKTDALTISWSPEDSGEMKLEVEGDCIFLYTKDVSDTGEHTIAAGELESTGGDKPETCELTAKLTRSGGGSTDPAYDPESSFTLHQVRSAGFTSAP